MEAGLYRTPDGGFSVYYFGDDNGLEGNNADCPRTWDSGSVCGGPFRDLAAGRHVRIKYEWCNPADNTPDLNGAQTCVWADLTDGQGYRFLARDARSTVEMYNHTESFLGDPAPPRLNISCRTPARMAGQTLRTTGGDWVPMTGQNTWRYENDGQYHRQNFRYWQSPATWEICNVGDPDPDPEPPNDPPAVSAGPDVSGDEGAPIALDGSATDDQGTPSVTWSYVPGAGVDPGATCTLADANATDTSVTCTDDGTYTATLTASDGKNPPVSDSATVTVRNAPPKLSLTGPAPWQSYKVRTPVTLTAPFTDAGANDTHTCTVAWDDTTQDTYPASNGTCNRPHTFAKAGMYTMKVTVTDDDGASSSTSVMVVVYDQDAGATLMKGWLNSPKGALAANPDHSGKAFFGAGAKYLHRDKPPVGLAKYWLDLGTDFRLQAHSLEWLVVTPDGKVAIKGTGKVNGEDGYGFVLYGYTRGPKVRLVTWKLSDGTYPRDSTVYDNVRGAGYDIDVANPQQLNVGAVTILPWRPIG